jgi:undecaprenyl-diphosphatase
MSATTSSRPAGTSARDYVRLRDQVVFAAAAAIFAVFTAAVRVGWTPLMRADASAADGLNSVVHGHPALVNVLSGISALGGAGVLAWLVALCAILLLARRRYRLAAYLAATSLGALVLDPGIKALVGRLRPVLEHPVAHGGGDSFPSGHALDSLICYGAVVLVLLPALSRRHRWILTAVAGTIVFLIGVSRVMLGVHFISDVLGGWSLGIAWLGLTVYAFELRRHQTGRAVTKPVVEGVEPEAGTELRLDASPGSPSSHAGSAAHAEPGPQTETHHALRAAAWLVVGLVAVFGIVVGLGALATRAGNNVLGDESVPRWFAAHQSATTTTLSDIGSRVGDTHGILAVGLVAGTIALGLLRQWRPVVFIVVVMFGELALFLAAAKVVGRPRPDVPQLDGPLPTSAYPSGHVAATLCLYVAIALLVFANTRAGWWRWLSLVPPIVVPVAVTLSRLYRGMHHPTDILGAAVLAAGWLTVCYVVLMRRPARSGPTGDTTTSSPTD